MNSHKLKIAGIVVEYNPFHNGHIYHIEKTRNLTQCDVLIAIMSSNFVQRGEPAIIDKWERTRAALNHGVDLVLELPTHIVLQSAQQFATHAVDMLALAGVTDLVYGSETLEIPQLTDFNADLIDQGFSYAKAKNSDHKAPNNILGAYYEQAAQKHHITTHRILRTNQYHSEEINDSIVSASAIRKAVLNYQDIIHTTPMSLDVNALYSIEDYYPFIQYEIIKENKTLNSRFLMREGLENKLYKEALLHDKYEDFLEACISKRYTASRIRRSLMHIYLHTPQHMPPQTTLRVLGMNGVGRNYLKTQKNNAKFATLFKETQYKDFEERASLLYALPYKDRLTSLSQKEKEGPIIVP
ncbi:hypothetical protein AOC36_05560 [Erysipelothrix larvae]|uniref:tRNA(Met) cytidine acetate ligase n=1 Tax=Erysipelothrix larvae TaxID=1514105 RepID=A0A109UGZ6_9FIRM|nr:nucleotidyltransferase family protein [Erysipelothrix larvae]AMC93463.1 hypothetical protein AOC36_05560 [Erysipelothrix larvae]